ncbi:MAG: hypothetical protein OJF49_000479 [Ktedonobacterales bacterium]|nr:MAG: hypothetical protein OJF49_000479 [Ktedonobacterales bacterium]
MVILPGNMYHRQYVREYLSHYTPARHPKGGPRQRKQASGRAKAAPSRIYDERMRYGIPQTPG